MGICPTAIFFFHDRGIGASLNIFILALAADLILDLLATAAAKMN